MDILDRLKGSDASTEPRLETTDKLRQGWHDLEARLRRRMRIYPSRWRRQANANLATEPGLAQAPTSSGNILALMADGFHASNADMQSAVPEAESPATRTAAGDSPLGDLTRDDSAPGDLTPSQRVSIISIGGRDLPPQEAKERRLTREDQEEAA